MRGFFEARHTAIFGASTRPGNLGARIVNNLLQHGYQGRITLIGRGGGALAGHCINETLPDHCRDVDLAVILTPAATVAAVMDQCGRAGVKRVIVESGGFAELDAAGAALQAEVQAVAAKYGIRFIGPNCIGVTNSQHGLAVPFPMMPQPPKGPVSLITQSGGVGLLYAHLFRENCVGLAKFASIGNKTDVDEVDMIRFFSGDDGTGVVLAYLESAGRGRELYEALRACPKPVVVHKANTSEASREIASSHTAALVNNDGVVDAAIKQAGALRAASLSDAVATIKALLLPPMKGDRVIVISRSGGQAIIAADECGRAGMVLPPLPAGLLKTINERDRAGIIRYGNPLDLGVLFDIESLFTVMDGAMAAPEADAVVCLIQLPQVGLIPNPERLLHRAKALCQQFDKPLVFVLQTAPELVTKVRTLSDFPFFEAAEEAVAALAAGRDWARARRQTPGRSPAVKSCPPAAALLDHLAPGAYLSQEQAFALLDCYGIAHPPVATARTAAEAERIFEKLGGPLAMKIESPDVVHKADVGGVILGIATAREARAAFLKMKKNLAARAPKARFAGALMMPMATRPIELIAGVKRDPSFGPVVMLGWGGAIAEAMEKVSLRLAPITLVEARQMLAELPGQKLFGAFRGRPAIDRAAVAELLVRLSRLACAPGIGEIDLNPIAVDADGARALDARVRKQSA